MKKNKKLTVLLPCYNEEEGLKEFVDAMIAFEPQIPDLDFEYLFINDGSTDNTLNIIREYAKKDSKFKYISFSRNFGKEPAVHAGIQHSTGDLLTMLDTDFQDPIELLVDMWDGIKNKGLDCVIARRVNRTGESWLRNSLSNAFYAIINKLGDTEIPSGVRDYRMMTKQVVDSIAKLPERDRFSKGLFRWVGYDVDYIEYENVERKTGTSKYNWKSLFTLATSSITSFSEKPLSWANSVGVMSIILSMGIGVWALINKFWLHNTNPGWASTIFTILVQAGIQLIILGIIGKYISKMFIEIKGRPIYIVKESEEDYLKHLEEKVDFKN